MLHVAKCTRYGKRGYKTGIADRWLIFAQEDLQVAEVVLEALSLARAVLERILSNRPGVSQS
jgi:hypothetical protein